MAKYFYAVYTPYGTSFTYETGNYSVRRFRSKASRDAWVKADDFRDGNPHREAVTRRIARRILGKYAVPVPARDEYGGEWLEPDPEYKHEW